MLLVLIEYKQIYLNQNCDFSDFYLTISWIWFFLFVFKEKIKNAVIFKILFSWIVKYVTLEYLYSYKLNTFVKSAQIVSQVL